MSKSSKEIKEAILNWWQKSKDGKVISSEEVNPFFEKLKIYGIYENQILELSETQVILLIQMYCDNFDNFAYTFKVMNNYINNSEENNKAILSRSEAKEVCDLLVLKKMFQTGAENLSREQEYNFFDALKCPFSDFGPLAMHALGKCAKYFYQMEL